MELDGCIIRQMFMAACRQHLVKATTNWTNKNLGDENVDVNLFGIFHRCRWADNAAKEE